MGQRDLVNLIQLGGTAFLLTAYPLLILIWYRLSRGISQDSGYRWIVIGTLFFFLGHCCDILYWSFPWSADFIGHPARNWLFDNGLYANVVFRQGAGVASVFCHYRAAAATANQSLKWALYGSIVVSIIVSVAAPAALLWIKFNG